MRSVFIFLIPVLLAGCTLAPEYKRPAAPIPGTYPGSAGSIEETAALPEWSDFFTDARLQAIIAHAIENNRDLRVAALNVQYAQSLYQIQRSALIPNLAGTGDATRQHLPADLSPTGSGTTGSTYTVGLVIPAYEIDFFGRVRSLRDQALNQYLATEEAHLSAQISLVSAVARQYLLTLALEEQLALARQIYEAAERSYELNLHTFESEISSELDLRTAETQRESVRASVAALGQQLAQANNALELLVGAPLPENLPPSGTLSSRDLLREDLPVGLPSELLIRRPDIRGAEYILMGANANIGAARAAFFPSISITALGGTASAELSNLFASGSGVWSFAPSVTVPIFTAGRNRAQLDAAEVQKLIEIAHYEKTIQAAFRDVADALVAKGFLDTQVDAQSIRMAAAQRRYDLSNQRFEAGIDSFLTVLLAQQELFNAEQDLVAAKLARLDNFISLYAVLGGGWE